VENNLFRLLDCGGLGCALVSINLCERQNRLCCATTRYGKGLNEAIVYLLVQAGI
jgi:hypothetical protein